MSDTRTNIENKALARRHFDHAQNIYKFFPKCLFYFFGKLTINYSAYILH